MKKQLATILMLLPLMGHSQTVSDTTFVYGDKQIVVNDTEDGVDITVLAKDGEEYRKTQETTFVDGKEVTQVYVTSPFLPSKWSNRHHFYCHIPAFSVGYSTMGGRALSFGSADAMHRGGDEKREITITAVDIAFPLNKQHTFGVSMGIQATFVRHCFSEGYGLYKDGNVVSVRPIDELGDGERFKKSYLSYRVMRFPVFFEFQNTFARSDFFVTLGASLEYRFNERSRVKTNHNTFTPTKDININPIGVSLEAQVGYSMVAVYMRTALTPLMKTSMAPSAYPTSLGIAFIF